VGRSTNRCRRLAQLGADPAGEHRDGPQPVVEHDQIGAAADGGPASMPASRAGVSVAALMASAKRTPQATSRRTPAISGVTDPASVPPASRQAAPSEMTSHVPT
jgi:hypothetical protein